MSSLAAAPARGTLTGRKVLLMFVAFFGTIVAADSFLLASAVRTWTGLEEASPYRAGQVYNRELRRVREQDGQGWHLTSRVECDGAGGIALTVLAQDRADAPLAGRTLTARFERPTDRREDRGLILQEVGAGRYEGRLPALAAGQWDLVVDVLDGDERRLRRKSRLVLR